MRNKAVLTAMMTLIGTPAFAGEPCRSAKDLVKVAQSFYGDNPELTNIVTPEFDLTFKGINGAATPTAIRFRDGDKTETLAIVDGKLVGFKKLAAWSKDGEMCRMENGEIAPETEGDSVEASMSFSFRYKRTDGAFTMNEIIEGAKDGSKVMSGLTPGGLGFVVPGLKAVEIRPAEEDAPVPSFEFTRKGSPVDVDIYSYGDQRLIRIKDIKKSKADALTITGDYRMFAGFKFDRDKILEAEAKRAAKAPKAKTESLAVSR